jgi:hypothetical protein
VHELHLILLAGFDTAGSPFLIIELVDLRAIDREGSPTCGAVSIFVEKISGHSTERRGTKALQTGGR